MTKCIYCDYGGPRPCSSTREMEESMERNPECFAALMFLGGGESAENQRKAAGYWRMVAGEIGKADMIGGPARTLTLPPRVHPIANDIRALSPR